MANISNNGTFKPHGTDENQLPLVKLKAIQRCKMCRELIPKGSMVVGKSNGFWYDRVCLNCADEYLKNFVNSVEAFKQRGIAVQKQLAENREEYEALNISAKI